DGDRGERLVAARAARAQLERDARHRGLVRGLHDRDEVDVPERRPLRLHARAELLDLLVDLPDPLGVVLDGLYALGGEGGEHDVGRHGDGSSVGVIGTVAPASRRSGSFVADDPAGAPPMPAGAAASRLAGAVLGAIPALMIAVRVG